MAPAKAARSGQDDSKADNPASKEKNGSGAGSQSNGKMRRVASSAGSSLREIASTNATNAAAAAAAAAAATSGAQEANTPGVSSRLTPLVSQNTSPNTLCAEQLQWPAFERDVLHAYRRAYRLKTPTAFLSDHHQWVLTQPGSIGLYSPTIARRKELRRQTTDQLTNVVRKHFNGLGVQENDVIVEFLHKARSTPSKRRPRRLEYVYQELER